VSGSCKCRSSLVHSSYNDDDDDDDDNDDDDIHVCLV